MKQLFMALTAIIIVVFSGCSKEDNNEHIISIMADKDSIMTDLFNELSENGNNFTDISTIPVQAELYDYSETDTGFRTAINAIETFNEMIGHPGILIGVPLKSTMDKSWQCLGCKEYGTMSVCTYIQDHGEYVFKCVQTIQGLTNSIIIDMYIGGTCNGINYSNLDEDEYYLKSQITTTGGNIQYTATIFFDPVNDDFANEVWEYYQYIVGEGRTIYTPWNGTERVINTTLNNILNIWDAIHGCHPSISTTIQWDGSLVTTLTSVYCANHDDLRLFYSSAYDFDGHEGSWCIYDCDEIPIDCGSN